MCVHIHTSSGYMKWKQNRRNSKFPDPKSLTSESDMVHNSPNSTISVEGEPQKSLTNSKHWWSDPVWEAMVPFGLFGSWFVSKSYLWNIYIYICLSAPKPKPPMLHSLDVASTLHLRNRHPFKNLTPLTGFLPPLLQDSLLDLRLIFAAPWFGSSRDIYKGSRGGIVTVSEYQKQASTPTNK